MAAIACGGSFTSGHGAFVETGFVGTPDGHPTSLVTDAVDPTTGKMRGFNGSDLYNYGALSYFQRPADRYTAGAFLHYDINDKVQLYYRDHVRPQHVARPSTARAARSH